jgi:hypothetical protein
MSTPAAAAGGIITAAAASNVRHGISASRRCVVHVGLLMSRRGNPSAASQQRRYGDALRIRALADLTRMYAAIKQQQSVRTGLNTIRSSRTT